MLGYIYISVLWMGTGATYFPNFGLLGDRLYDPMCFEIPKDMALCADIGYSQMRLPNLLEHDSLTEVKQQSQSWLPLINVRCHPFTQLFLCSLFTPVCLEKLIYPCRSLCLSVKEGCENRMQTYGYNWPEMLRCDNFPEDNDMCIKPPAKGVSVNATRFKGSLVGSTDCPVCKPVDTYENILDNFCTAPVVIKARIHRFRNEEAVLHQIKVFKAPASDERMLMKQASLALSGEGQCCSLESSKQMYLIMGSVDKRQLLIQPSFVLGWQKRSKIFRDATKMFRKLNCSDPNLFSPSLVDGTILPRSSLKNKEKKWKKNKKKNKEQMDRKGISDGTGEECRVCQKNPTYEHIIRNYCEAEFGVRGSVKRIQAGNILLRKVRVYKSPAEHRQTLLRRPKLTLQEDLSCCSLSQEKTPLIVMGKLNKLDSKLSPTFIIKWQKTKDFRKAVRTMKTSNCSDSFVYQENDQDIIPAKTVKNRKKQSKDAKQERNSG